ncbi:iron transporter FeoC [Vibrio sp. JPW-9-11-11]|uniref:FeoC-like transcriptional regulator n=1 Tax=Vibrio sp. JPW-9-11-11 TaxID=1416532 RepID=UPI001593974D|nr:FeoC-like transcriptional regulator [Vibrio sp. JPW-9-11-11]NVD06172.1 iron transporter FeoC [Vibrio sp. JPW-9-11-11]
MILTQMKQHLEQTGCVSRKELARQFHLSEDGVDAMLSIWIKKGLVMRLVDTNDKQRVTRVRYRHLANDQLPLTVTM